MNNCSIVYTPLYNYFTDSLNYLDNEVVTERHELFIFLVRLCGDIQLKLGSKSNIDRYRAEYQNCSMDEDAIVKSIANVLADSSECFKPW